MIDDQTLTLTFVTAPTPEVAEELSTALVTQGFAACVNILPGIKSVYEWEGKLEKESEVLLLVKSTRAKNAQLHNKIRELHPYKVPEIVTLNAAEVSPAYLDWVRLAVAKSV